MKQMDYVAMSNRNIMMNDIMVERVEHVLTTDRKTAKCCFCGTSVKPSNGERVTTPSHPRGLTLCDEHVEMCDTLDFSTYSQENTETVGKPTAKGLTCSFELETTQNTTTAIASLCCDLGFFPSEDSSLGYRGIEYKSRIFNSLNSATKTLGTIEWLLENGYVNTLDRSCGGHIHTGFYNDPVDFRSLYGSIEEYMDTFGGLYAYLEKMPNDKMLKYFGRGFTNYARTIRKNSQGKWYMPQHDGRGHLINDGEIWLYETNDYGNPVFNRPLTMRKIHSCVFNLQHSYSIEFRLPKFVSAVQYRKCILAMQEVVDVLRKYNFHGCGSNMVEVFKKYFPY